MNGSAIEPQYPVFTDLKGEPLENGFVYIGLPGQNPITAPKAVFWDAAQLIPATQPIRTLAGYLALNGSPGVAYTTGLFSMLVQDRKGQLVYSALNQSFYNDDGSAYLSDYDSYIIPADGRLTAYSLIRAPANLTWLEVSVDGLNQLPTTHYVTQEMVGPTSLGLRFNVPAFGNVPQVGQSIHVRFARTLNLAASSCAASAESALASEAAAAVSAASSLASSNAAAASEIISATSATGALASSNAATASQTASAASATGAAASSTAATASQSAAATSATNASNSATAASSSATGASASATTAVTNAATSTTQAGNASTSATASAASATAAGTSATSAAASATAAEVAKITWRGTWVTATAYVLRDAVQRNGSSFVVNTAHTSAALTAPNDGADWATRWDVLSLIGATGPVGPGGPGSGDVLGPASAVNDRIAVYDGTTGKLLKDGGSAIAAVLARSAHTGTQAVGTITGLAAVATSGSATDLTTGTLPIARVADGAVTLAKQADVATARVMGRVTAATGVQEALTAAQTRTLLNVADGATANAADAALRDRATHTGTQAAGTITGLASVATSGSATDLTTGTLPIARVADGAITKAKLENVATSTIRGRVTAATGIPEDLTAAQTRTLLNVADGATANASDASLRDRATHTGTQAVGTITGLATVATSASATDLTTGILPAARFNDTAHGTRAGGTLHANAVAAGGAGFMTGADKTKLDAITGTNTGNQTTIVGITGTKAQFDTAVTDGNILYVGDAPTAHTHLLAAGATDVTITAGNLNTLDDGATTALHFHDADRARGNHTGTQAVGTITGLASVATSGSATDLATGTLPIARVADGAITKAKLENVATATIRGRTTAGTGIPEDLTATQVRTLLNVADGALANDYATRAALVTWRASNSPAVGSTITAGGLSYFFDNISTALTDLPGFVVPDNTNVSLGHFNAPTNGTTNATPAILAAVTYAAGRKVVGQQGVTYDIETTLDYTGSINLDLSMSKVTISADVEAFVFRAPAVGPFALTADYNPVATPLVLAVATLPFAPKAGQVVWISSRARDLGDRDNGSESQQYRTGEAFRLGFGSTTTSLVLERPLVQILGGSPVSTAGDEAMIASYTTAMDTRIALPDMDARCDVALPQMAYTEGQGPAGWNKAAVTFWAYVGGRCVGGAVTRGYGSGVRVWGTYGFTVDTFAPSNLEDNNPQLGYGVADGGWNTRVIGLNSHRVRHSYTTSKSSTSYTVAGFDAHKILTFGRTAGAQIVGGISSGGVAAAWTTHQDAENLTFSGNFADGVADDAFAIRGRNVNIVNPMIRNCQHGILYFTEYDSGDPDEDFYNNGKRLLDFTSGLIDSPDMTVTGRCIDVRAATVQLGGTGRYRTQSQCVIYNSGGTLHISGTHRIVVDGAHVPDIGTRLIEVAGNNIYSSMAFANPRVVIDGFLEIDARLWTGAALTALDTATGTQIIVRGLLRLLLPTGATIFSGTAANFICEGNGRIEYSIAGSSGIVTGLSAHPIYLIDLTSGAVMDGTTRRNEFVGYNQLTEATGNTLIVRHGSAAGDGVMLRNTDTAVSDGESIGGITVETNDTSNPAMVAARTLYRGNGSIGFVDTVFQRSNVAGTLVDAMSVKINGDVQIMRNDGTTIAAYSNAASGAFFVTFPGPFANDTAAAAASPAVAVGQAYRQPGGFIAWRQV